MRLELKQEVDNIHKKQDLFGQVVSVFIEYIQFWKVIYTYNTGSAADFQRFGICQFVVFK